MAVSEIKSWTAHSKVCGFYGALWSTGHRTYSTISSAWFEPWGCSRFDFCLLPHLMVVRIWVQTCLVLLDADDIIEVVPCASRTCKRNIVNWKFKRLGWKATAEATLNKFLSSVSLLCSFFCFSWNHSSVASSLASSVKPSPRALGEGGWPLIGITQEKYDWRYCSVYLSRSVSYQKGRKRRALIWSGLALECLIRTTFLTQFSSLYLGVKWGIHGC